MPSPFSKLRMCDMSAYFGPDPDNCQVPPPGWWCSREPGHGGPCAARPYNDDPRLTVEQQDAQYERFKAGTLFEPGADRG